MKKRSLKKQLSKLIMEDTRTQDQKLEDMLVSKLKDEDYIDDPLNVDGVIPNPEKIKELKKEYTLEKGKLKHRLNTSHAKAVRAKWGRE